MTKAQDQDPKTGRFVKGNKYSFKNHPERINLRGRWNPEESISEQYNRLIRMNVGEFKVWLRKHPESERTMAQDIAYQAVMEAKKDLQYLKEVTDRTEGKAPQSLDVTTGGESLNIFEDEQIDRIARRRVSGGGKVDGDSSSEK